jgi:dienelactone hydrolase
MQIRIALLCLAALLPSVVVADTTERTLEYEVDGKSMRSVLVYGGGAAKRPGLVLVPNWMGVNESAIAKAKEIAGDKYVVLVADVYGADVRPANGQEAGAAAKAMYADLAALRARAAAAVRELSSQAGSAPLDAGRIGAIGFCFGGATVIELARSGADIAGVVSFHGNLATDMPAAKGALKASVLVQNGADDTYVPAQQIAAFQQEMTAAGADWQFVNYAGAVHCFAEPDANSGPGCLYHERSAKRAFRLMDDFFAERFAAR